MMPPTRPGRRPACVRVTGSDALGEAGAAELPVPIDRQEQDQQAPSGLHPKLARYAISHAEFILKRSVTAEPVVDRPCD